MGKRERERDRKAAAAAAGEAAERAASATAKGTLLSEADVVAASKYFDALVELVPARVYLGAEGGGAAEGQQGGGRQQKREAKAAAKRDAQSASHKSMSKKAKRLKLDPGEAASTLELQLGHAAEEAKAAAGEEREAGAAPAAAAGGAPAPAALQWRLDDGDAGGNGSSGKEALHARLQKRLEHLRAQRRADEAERRKASAQAFEKQKRGGKQQQANGAAGKQGKKRKGVGGAPEQPPGGEVAAAEPVALDLQYGQVELGGGPLRPHKKQKATKEKLLDGALKRLQAVEAAGGKRSAEGKALEKEHAWKASLQRAQGDKVLDDPRLLKKSLKKAEAKKRKSAAAWEERKERVVEQQKAKQDKRRKNLKERAAGKIARRIEKGARKRLRPGFEGRKDGMINGSSS